MIIKEAQPLRGESGFTLVELLVVIAIIAILTAIAVPAFLSQRQKANDAAVRSDVKNVATEIETGLIDNIGEIVVTYSAASGQRQSVIRIDGKELTRVPLSDGVSIVSAAPGGVDGYVLHGYHVNGSKYKPASGSANPQPLRYESANGGFVN